ncbi:hypothetical protein CLCR_07784 [Cladophialophora carrionii]|uniref:Uncharacterized protein n=1 Tax=Cladophialophora carrionii TaxID=86049 RepID=A0A1C1CND0_9EURO|nr:hypothetical protein CLCR_07784 [Cladophialophora carrionii]
MIDSRGGLDTLALDGMVKSSFLQSLFGRFESWWTLLYNDTSVFDPYKPAYNPTYLSLSASPSANELSRLSQLPPGVPPACTGG